MTITPIAAHDAPLDGAASHPQAPTGIYALPIAGPQLQRARNITEGLRPTAEDSVPQVVAKRAAQASVITGAAALAALVIL